MKPEEKYKSAFWICLDCVRREGWPTFSWVSETTGRCAWCYDGKVKELVKLSRYIGKPRKHIQ